MILIGQYVSPFVRCVAIALHLYAIAYEHRFGDVIGHTEHAAACALRFTQEAHPGLFDAARWPAPVAHAAACEATDVFRAISRPFVPPA